MNEYSDKYEESVASSMPTVNPDDLFDDAAKGKEFKTRMYVMATQLVITDDARKELKGQLKELDGKYETIREQIAEVLTEAGYSGQMYPITETLKIKPTVKRKYYTAKGATRKDLIDWFMARKLYPSLQYSSLQPLLREYEGTGKDLPESLINVVEEPAIAVYGASKFLAELNEGVDRD